MILSLMDMQFSVKSDLPIKTDSHVAILSFSPLGDNHLEIKAGSPGCATGSFRIFSAVRPVRGIQ